MGVRKVSFTKGRKYKVNAVKCKKCGSFLNSTDPALVLYCKCGTIWISGGKDKALRGGVLNFIEEHSVYV